MFSFLLCGCSLEYFQKHTEDIFSGVYENMSMKGDCTSVMKGTHKSIFYGTCFCSTSCLMWCSSGVNLMLALGFILWPAQCQEVTVILDFLMDKEDVYPTFVIWLLLHQHWPGHVDMGPQLCANLWRCCHSDWPSVCCCFAPGLFSNKRLQKGLFMLFVCVRKMKNWWSFIWKVHKWAKHFYCVKFSVFYDVWFYAASFQFLVKSSIS